MLITRKHLSRRTILRGAGVSLALPFLDSMVPAQTPISKTAATPRPRLCCIEMVHGSAGSTTDGSNKHYWSPEKEGSDFELTQTLEPLAPYRDYLTIVSDTDLNPAGAFADAEEGGDQADHGRRHLLRRFHRPDVRAAVRPGHAAAVHPALY
jgi:hypothetical protein